MAYMKVIQGETLPNFLESAVGLVQKTEMVTQAMATTVDTKKLIYGGTAFPSNDSNATGIVFETVDMIDDTKRPASVIKAGRIYGNRLKIELTSAAKTALAAKGFVILDAPEVEF
jgi:mevalonate kinase